MTENSVYERKRLVARLIELFGGPILSLEQIHVVKNPRGGNRIATEGGKIFAVMITRQYLLGPTEKLVAIVAHEFSNTLDDSDLGKLDKAEVFFVRQCKKIGLALPSSGGAWSIRSRIATFLTVLLRTLFEGLLFGFVRILRRKKRADMKAIALLREHLFPVYGYLSFLDDAKHRSSEFQFPRRLWHRWIVKQRIQAVHHHLRTL